LGNPPCQRLKDLTTAGTNKIKNIAMFFKDKYDDSSRMMVLVKTQRAPERITVNLLIDILISLNRYNYID